jgi:hypothetical protein
MKLPRAGSVPQPRFAAKTKKRVSAALNMNLINFIERAINKVLQDSVYEL